MLGSGLIYLDYFKEMDVETIVEECEPIQRRLSAWEINEARKVFGNKLDYLRVRLYECSAWPNFMDRLGRRLKSLPPPAVPNAITIWNTCYFPVRLLQEPVPVWHPDHYKISWLIHELTHVWQYQNLGISYIYKAVKAQFRGGIHAYDFGGENGLQESLTHGKKLNYFNLEQQGEICRSYYDRLARGDDIGAWLPYILEIQKDCQD
jgi:hypothetical protein